jgi:hypothetical protein
MGYPSKKGFGKGKGGDSKGWKGGGKSQANWSSSWGSDSWDADSWHGGGASSAAAEEPTVPSGHIKAMYRLPRKLLAPYAGTGGSCLYGDVTDDQKFEKKHLKEMLSPMNSEWQRPCRLAVAMSEFASSACALVDSLQEFKFSDGVSPEMAKMGAPALAKLFDTPAGKKFHEAVQFLNFGDIKEAKEKVVAKHTMVVTEFCREHKKALHEGFARLAIASSRFYVGSMQGLEAVLHLSSLKSYGNMLPKKQHDAVDLWKKSPDDKEKFAKCIGRMYGEMVATKKKYKSGGNSASSVFGAWQDSDDEAVKPAGSEEAASDSDSGDKSGKGQKRKRSSSSSSGSSSSKKTKKGKKGRKDKKDQKEKKDKKKSKSKKAKKSSSDSSSASSEKKKKKGKKEQKEKETKEKKEREEMEKEEQEEKERKEQAENEKEEQEEKAKKEKEEQEKKAAEAKAGLQDDKKKKDDDEESD